EADGPLLDGAARRALLAACEDAARVLAELDAEERERRAREREVERLRGLCDRARERAAEAIREAAAARDLREERGRDAERGRRELTDREERLEALAAELAPALAPWPRWRERLREDGGAPAAGVRSHGDAWRSPDAACAEAARGARRRPRAHAGRPRGLVGGAAGRGRASGARGAGGRGPRRSRARRGGRRGRARRGAEGRRPRRGGSPRALGPRSRRDRAVA